MVRNSKEMPKQETLQETEILFPKRKKKIIYPGISPPNEGAVVQR